MSAEERSLRNSSACNADCKQTTNIAVQKVAVVQKVRPSAIKPSIGIDADSIAAAIEHNDNRADLANIFSG